jgi:hypothetical protein
MGNDVETLDELQLSVARLQRQNRWLAICSALIGLGLVISIVAPDRFTRSRRFELRDDGNRQRGMWRVRDGDPSLVLQDRSGRWRASLAIDGDGPYLRLMNRRGEPSIALNTLRSEALFAMYDRQGRPRIRITVTDAGPRMEFLDPEGQAISTLPEPR